MNELSRVPTPTSAYSLLVTYGKMRVFFFFFRGDKGRAHSDLAKLARERVFLAEELVSKEEVIYRWSRNCSAV